MKSLPLMTLTGLILRDNTSKIIDAKKWIGENGGKACIMPMTASLFPLILLILLIFLPAIVLGLMGRVVTCGLLISYLPDAMFLLIASTLLVIAQAVLRVYWLTQQTPI